MELNEIKSKIAIIFNTKDIENIEDILSYADLGQKIKEVLAAITEMSSDKLDLANQQIIGYKYGKWNSNDVVGLINEMGLNIDEWTQLKTMYHIENDLEEKEINEIDQYFSGLANKV